MSVYLDASVLVALFINDVWSSKAIRKVSGLPSPGIVSNFACAEVASAIGKKLRMREVTVAEARRALTDFDSWRGAHTIQAEVSSGDLAVCDAYLRRLDSPLRTPDAINIAVAHRLAVPLLTFDATMARCARKIGLAVQTA